ncbi:NlpC/P60 family protein [Streptomyces sp. NPDC013455]|uniref:NlpC/P60 family protein n=1 Tax=Streptomyces sp. NPDC013455 TaxID=3155605 RepID=UPI0033F2A0DC
MASHRKPRPGGTQTAGIRTPALATAALTSVAMLSQSSEATYAAGHGKPSAEEVERKIDDLYRRAESGAGTSGTGKERIVRGDRAERAGWTERAERTGKAERTGGTGREEPAEAPRRRADSLQRLRDEVARRAARTRALPAQRGTTPGDRTPGDRTPAQRGAAPAQRGAAPARHGAAPDSAVAGTAVASTAVASTAVAGSRAEVPASGPKAAKAAVQKKLAHARVLVSRRTTRATPPTGHMSQPADQAPQGPDHVSRGPAQVPQRTGQVPQWTGQVSQRTGQGIATPPMPSRPPVPSVPPASSAPSVSPASPAPSVPPASSAPSVSPASPAPSVPSGGHATKAREAVAFARAQLGKPCVWGAAGPGSYDCSGLTQAAWKSAGVTLPRTAREQAAAGTPVPPAEARPGDLVFFDDVSHVGLCTGDGMMVHAPRPGDYVREEPVSGVGRPAVHSVVRPG